MGSSIKEIRARGLSDEEKSTLQNASKAIKELSTKLDVIKEETNNIFARIDFNYAVQAQESIRSNFIRINLKPEEAYAYLYPDNAAQATTYPYNDIYKHIEEKLALPDTSKEDKEILRQLGHIFRTASGKEQFDAYLNNTLEQLKITNQREQERIAALYQEINTTKEILANQEDRIKQLIR